jgi:hypothetical protein
MQICSLQYFQNFQLTTRFCTPPSPNSIMQSITTITNIFPLLVHAHCTAALPISCVECLVDMGIGKASIISPAISFYSKPSNHHKSPLAKMRQKSSCQQAQSYLTPSHACTSNHKPIGPRYTRTASPELDLSIKCRTPHSVYSSRSDVALDRAPLDGHACKLTFWNIHATATFVNLDRTVSEMNKRRRNV